MIGRNSAEPGRDEILFGFARSVQREIVEDGRVSNSLLDEIAGWEFTDAELGVMFRRICQMISRPRAKA